MARNIFDALRDAVSAIEDDVGDKLVLLPPSNDPYASDEEVGDDDIGFGGNIDLPNDVTGTVEVQGNESDSDSDDNEPNVDADTWRNGTRLFQDMAIEHLSPIEETHPSLVDKSPLELYKMFFDKEVEKLFIEFSNLYASQNNEHDFQLDRDDLWDFFTIITISGYNMRSQFSMYWSVEEDIGLPIVRQLMSRNKFRKIKKFLHCCNNTDLIVSDKWAKLRPLIDVVNKKLIQFGVFTDKLSIDEQMVPYFGRHSCKMFIRGKPIRFGYKNWVLCDSSGYPYKVIPYQGKDREGNDKSPLGPSVVLRLLEVLEKPKSHEVIFDNFFTSTTLMNELRSRDIKATGTIRSNRLKGSSLDDIKAMEKENRGTMSVSSTKKLCAVRWVDNKVVTLLSNHLTHEPVSECKRYVRAEKARVSIKQPNVVKEYNKNMGGVDQLDAYLNNLRPCVGGKKWYWTQMINMVRLLQVASFTLYNHLHKENTLSQLEFLRSITTGYILKDKNQCKNVEVTRIVPLSANNHYITTFTQGRCKVCKKNTKKGCYTCNFRLHENCFPVYHD